MSKKTINIKPNNKQFIAWHYMRDVATKYIFYGGAVRGGKTFFMCLNAILICLEYRGARCLLSRRHFSDFKLTTFNTLIEVLNILRLEKDKDYFVSMQNKYLRFVNTSEIVFPPLGYEPSDPEYTKIGGLELTHAYVDEAVEITYKLFQILKTRVGSLKATNGKVPPKIFLASNPVKSWIKDIFVEPAKMGTLNSEYKYIFANYLDNKENLTKEYIDSILSIEDDVTKSRLIYGNWDYDDSKNKLFDYQSIMSCFGFANIDFLDDGIKYMTIDVARFGKDKSVIGIWQGNYLYDVIVYEQNSIEVLYKKVQELQKKHNILTKHIVADEDGVGGGLVDFLHCHGFVNNSVSEGYQNLKTKCIFETATLINSGALFIKDNEYKYDIINELDKYNKIETNDGKLKCTDKKTLKIALGRSPDFSDMIIMKRYFDSAQKIKIPHAIEGTKAASVLNPEANTFREYDFNFDLSGDYTF